MSAKPNLKVNQSVLNKCSTCHHEWKTIFPPPYCPKCLHQTVLRSKEVPSEKKMEDEVERAKGKNVYFAKVFGAKLPPKITIVGLKVTKPPFIKTSTSSQKVEQPKLTGEALKAEKKIYREAGKIVGTAPIKLKPRSSNAPHIIVDALAGTGKSFTILETVFRMIGIRRPNIIGTDQQEAIWAATEGMQCNPEDIAILAFNTSIRDEMKVKAPAGVYVNTCHAFGKQILAQKGVKGARDKYGVRKKKTFYILADILNVELNELYGLYKWPLLFAIKQFVGFCKLNLIEFSGDWETDCATIRQLAFIHGSLIPQKDEDLDFFYKMVIDCYNLSHTRLDVIDFDDMLYLPWKLKYRGRTYKMVCGDEAQDFSLAQQDLICNHADRLMLARDVNQAIYGFAGADIKACETMDKRLSMPGRGVQRFPLTWTRRCSKAVTKYAQKIIPEFQHFPEAAAGAILNDKEESFLDRVNPGDMIECRTNAPLFACCLRLFRQGRKFKTTVKNEFEQCLNLIKSFEAQSLEYLDDKLLEWKKAQLKRCKGANNDRAILIVDTYDSIKYGMEMVSSVAELIDLIQKVFGISQKDEEGEDKVRKITDDRIYLTSIHQAKGLEANKVWWLQYDLLPHPKAQLLQQEENLKWVACTRAIDTLVLVKSKEKKREEDEWE